MGIYLRNEPCPVCGGSDSVGVFDDNGVINKYCFKCRENTSNKNPKAKLTSWPPVLCGGSVPTHRQLESRRLTRSTCIKYDCVSHGGLVFFPCYWNGKVIGYKCRDFTVSKKHPRHMYIVGSYNHLIGWNAVHNNKVIAITLGEFDAYSVQQVAGLAALSSSNGDASLVKNVRNDYALLQEFEKIIFIPDKDKPTSGVSPSEAVAEATAILGEHKCFIASPSLDDPNEYLKTNQPSLLKQLVWSARPASASYFHSSSKDLILPSTMGSFTGWEELDTLIKGIRMCETTYIVGEPLAGKTTLLQWWMWQMAMRGLNIASFVLEGSQRSFTTKLANIFYGGNIALADIETRHKVSSAIDQRITVSQLDGRASPEELENAVRCAVLQFNCDVIVVDNITAISDPSANNASTTRYVKMFDNLSTDLGCHVIVLCHIGRDSYGERPTLRSASGSSAVEKHCQNMIAIHKLKNRHREIGVLKCREYDDAVDKWWTQPFDKTTSRYVTGVYSQEFV